MATCISLCQALCEEAAQISFDQWHHWWSERYEQLQNQNQKSVDDQLRIGIIGALLDNWEDSEDDYADGALGEGEDGKRWRMAMSSMAAERRAEEYDEENVRALYA